MKNQLITKVLETNMANIDKIPLPILLTVPIANKPPTLSIASCDFYNSRYIICESYYKPISKMLKMIK